MILDPYLLLGPGPVDEKEADGIILVGLSYKTRPGDLVVPDPFG